MIAVFDIDGTLTRIGKVPSLPLEELYLGQDDPTPNLDMIHMVRVLSLEYDIVFCTSRFESQRTKTLAFLCGNLLDVDFTLLMRPTGDITTDDVTLKHNLLKQFFDDISLIVEDNTEVVNHFRSLGFTVLQPSVLRIGD